MLDAVIVDRFQQDISAKVAISLVQIKMAKVIITIKIMPTSPEIDFKKIEKEADVKIKKFGAELGKVEIEDIAFGLKALKLFLISDESLGGTDTLEEDIKKIKGVNSVNVIDVRRAIG